MAELSSDVRYIKGIGEKKSQALGKLGVSTLYELISHFPYKYEDRTVFSTAGELQDGEKVCLDVFVADTPVLTRVRKGMELVKFRVADETGIVNITYFNQSYVKNNLDRGDRLHIYGKVEIKGSARCMSNPVYEKLQWDGTYPDERARNFAQTGRIVPVYRVCSGISNKVMAMAVRSGLDACSDMIPEIIPEDVIRRNRLCTARFAYENIHFPADNASLEIARRRMIFEELFVLACALGKIRSGRKAASGIVLPQADISEFISSLPFTPTGAQIRAINEALADMRSGNAMNRLVQGDVGSGKTLVAAALIWYVCRCGYTAAFMAPTEILAEQHYRTLGSLLGPFGIRTGLLTGGMSAKEKRLAKERLRNGETDLIIGTHALFSDDVEYSRLALVVTDEQHRFGVNQRAALIGKGVSPHVYVMSATPIPRTLALIMYGDLDVSIIDELPPGRTKVGTFAVDESYRERLNGFIRKQVSEGRQVFVVCPMVEENEELATKLKSAEEHAAELSGIFPDLSVECVHGRMKPKEKEAVMERFVSGSMDILVSTTVIEVGVDVPNATLMIIENADRFGLSQLHQLRGRVGRGKHQSWCILVSDSDSEDAKSRLGIMTKTSDGFRISEEDLRLRGPGDFFGSRQHGLPEMHIADLGADMNVLQTAQQEALLLLAEDPALSKAEHSVLRDRISRLFENASGTLN